MTNATTPATNREVKSSAFTAFFSDPANAAKLYAALDDQKAVSAEDIIFQTLNGVLFMARKNDMAFTVNNKVLVISEHQSTLNANMPLRDAIYYGRTMEKLIEPRALYRTGQIPIPTPEFFVFYNGTDNFPAEKILKLSDAYLEKTDSPMLELKVRIININLPVNHPILERCRPLYEYSFFIQKIRDYIDSGKSRDEAIIQAMKDCEQEGIMAEFLREHGTEAVNMLFTEFNVEDALEVRFGEGQESMLKLVNAMIADGRSEEIARLQQDLEFRKEMFTLYHINDV
ncbi:hypothetical protein [Clostridium sp. AN503]|uniref:hypothetical protein n=1 Tax=Clostridium sp. AN503 TaxID=3160598 RepID=UPI0034577851